MKLHYCQYENLTLTSKTNVGDDLNPFIWSVLADSILDEDDNWLFVGIGTILDSIADSSKAVIFGSGYRYGQRAPRIDLWQIYCVRGPLTARALNIDPALAVVDPGVLAPLVLPRPEVVGELKPGFVPHVSTMSAYHTLLDRACSYASINLVDPRLSPKEFITRLSGCSFVLTEAMHGAILADAYEVPWVFATTGPQIDHWKWRDWMESVECVQSSPVRIRSLATACRRSLGKRIGLEVSARIMALQLSAVAARARPNLTRRAKRSHLVERLLSRLDRLKADVANGQFR